MTFRKAPGKIGFCTAPSASDTEVNLESMQIVGAIKEDDHSVP